MISFAFVDETITNDGLTFYRGRNLEIYLGRSFVVSLYLGKREK